MAVELLPTRPGQPRTMTIVVSDLHNEHWYSPEFVRTAVNFALEKAAFACMDEQVPVNESQSELVVEMGHSHNMACKNCAEEIGRASCRERV